MPDVLVRRGEWAEFDCPGCGVRHGAKVEGLGAWTWNGSRTAPSFQPSILFRTYAGDQVKVLCHSVVTNGQIEFQGDCNHRLAGQTVPLPPIKKRG